MIDFKKRSYTPELLDADDIPSADLFQNLKELKIINTLLGGHRVVLNGIAKFSQKASSLFVVEIGSGGGDNLGAIRSKYPDFFLEGVDLKRDCTTYARSHNPTIRFQTADYQKANFHQTPDLLFNSLFCHHFNDEQLVEMLQWMHQNSTQGFFIADLHRHGLAYYSIKLLTQLFSRSYLVRNDAPLSVRRGFRQSEWEALLAKAGITDYTIRWQWAFRFLIVVKHAQT
jgi:hypothetical protein